MSPCSQRPVTKFCQYIKATIENVASRTRATLPIFRRAFTACSSFSLHHTQNSLAAYTQFWVVRRKTKDSDALFSMQEGFDTWRKLLYWRKPSACLMSNAYRGWAYSQESKTEEQKGWKLKRNLCSCLEAARRRQANQKRSGDGFSFCEGKTLKFYWTPKCKNPIGKQHSTSGEIPLLALSEEKFLTRAQPLDTWSCV